MEKEEIIELWKKLKVTQVRFEFSCGGDSMSDTTFFVETVTGDIVCDEITDYFEDLIYKKVEFYENSDGHYQGESGNVYITLDEEENDFDYGKSSLAEWCETVTTKTEIELTDEQITFIKDKVLNINGSMDEVNINFKKTCILSDREEQIIDELQNHFADVLRSYTPDTCSIGDGELQEWFTFTTNEEDEDLEIEGNCAKVTIDNSVTVYTDGE